MLSNHATDGNVADRERCRSGTCRNRARPNVLRSGSRRPRKEGPMLYAILAYHDEDEVQSWTREQDAALMRDLDKVHDRLTRQGRLGPAARLGATGGGRVLRGQGQGGGGPGALTATQE